MDCYQYEFSARYWYRVGFQSDICIVSEWYIYHIDTRLGGDGVILRFFGLLEEDPNRGPLLYVKLS